MVCPMTEDKTELRNSVAAVKKWDLGRLIGFPNITQVGGRTRAPVFQSS